MKTVILFLIIFTQLTIARDRAYCNHGHSYIPEIVEFPKNLWDISGLKNNETEVKSSVEKKSFSKQAKGFETFSIGMRLLFISATNNPQLETTISQVTTTMDAYGIPYDHIVLTEDGDRLTEDKINLVDKFGNPKYYGIIYSTNDLVFESKNKLFESALTVEQKQKINDYQKKFSVRKVSLFSFPNPKMGVTYLSELSSVADNTIMTTDMVRKFDPSLNENLSFDISNHWHYAGRATEANIQVTPYLKYKDGNLAAAIATYDDGREELHFFFAQSQFTKISLVISSSWINWLTKGMYVGKRRIFLNAQIDDVFLETDLWNPYLSGQQIDGSYIYRTMPDDLQFFADWQKSYLRPRTLDPAFKIEHAFNGQGIWKNGGYKRDGLYYKAKELLGEFNWLSHTYTHPDFNFTTLAYADWELKANLEITKDLFGSLDYPTFSADSMVTPRISGLFNPNALEAIFTNGIQNVTGDNTRPELLESLFWGQYTTQNIHGFNGVFIIPRHSTVIYYNVSQPHELADEYNHLYFNHFGRDLTFDEIITREVDRVSRYLLNYEPSPYMFHQANLRSFKWKNGRHTLLGIWMEGIIEELRKFHNLPILSSKMSDLSNYFRDRVKFNDCKFDARIIIKNGTYSKIAVENSQNCKIPITTLGYNFEAKKLELYGPDKTIVVEDNYNLINLN